MFSNAASFILILQTNKRRCEEVKFLTQLERGRVIYRFASAKNETLHNSLRTNFLGAMCRFSVDLCSDRQEQLSSYSF